MIKFTSSVALLLTSTLAMSTSLSFEGDMDVQVKTENSIKPLTVKLPKIRLSPEGKHYLTEALKHYSNKAPQRLTTNELPRKVQLGMLGTPVLNQGYHGSCVTFAVTAVLDATLGAGDYISQLCNLELGSYLAINGKIEYSGWDGTWGTDVLSQIQSYGVIGKKYQTSNGCAGVKKYPMYDEKNIGNPMDEADFTRHSIPIGNVVSSESLLMSDNAFSQKMLQSNIVDKVRQELALGNRLSIGMLLDVNVLGVGAAGTHKVPYDTWMLTPQIIADAMNDDIYAGHELVLTGYDDDAVVVDENGFENRGVFTLRNSWSNKAGDHGDYYVTYDYLRMLADEVIAIRIKDRV